MRKSVVRKTVDFNSSVITHLKGRAFQVLFSTSS
jgi:hypothetical protein